MIGVKQTIFKPPLGNCYSACLASILELSLDQVPNYIAEEKWYLLYGRWLRQANLDILTFSGPQLYDPELWIEQEERLKGFTIVGVESFRGPWGHSVVAKDLKIIWDPNPEIEIPTHELYKIESWTMFVVVDPSIPVNIKALL